VFLKFNQAASKVIPSEKQSEVVQVLRCMQKKSEIKNAIGYLQQLVKSVQADSFSPIKPKPKAKPRVVQPAIEEDLSDFDVEAYCADLKARYQPSKKANLDPEKVHLIRLLKQALHSSSRA